MDSHHWVKLGHFIRKGFMVVQLSVWEFTALLTRLIIHLLLLKDLRVSAISSVLDFS